MPFIAARNFATGNQQYLSMSTADYFRTLSIGNNWSRIRIGVLLAMPTVYETTNVLRGSALGIGVTCEGCSISQQFPNHAFGFGVPHNGPDAVSTANWTYNAGTGGNSYFSATGWGFAKWAAGVKTTSAVGGLTVNLPSYTTLGGALARRGILILDISKSALISGNITQGVQCGVAAHMALDITTNDLYSALEWYASAPTVQGVALTSLSLGNSLTFNEATNGALNNVSLYWNHYVLPLQLYEIAVYRVG